MFKEENAVVLDFLSRGYSSSYTGEPIAQALGITYFTLLELVPKGNIHLSIQQRVYIGSGERKEIKTIKGRLTYDKLTQTAKNELKNTVESLIRENEKRFVDFFNKAGPISIRKHSLELIPNIGKKHCQAILEERDKKSFTSFKDLVDRVHLMPDPIRVITERILEELSDENAKYYLFTSPPRREEERYR